METKDIEPSCCQAFGNANSMQTVEGETEKVCPSLASLQLRQGMGNASVELPREPSLFMSVWGRLTKPNFFFRQKLNLSVGWSSMPKARLAAVSNSNRCISLYRDRFKHGTSLTRTNELALAYRGSERERGDNAR